MSQLFLSHSSKDNFAALALSDWLRTEGWDDLFLDLDPERGIVAGERWERALHDAANRCDAVLFLVSSNWLASEWCLREFDLAHRLNKRIFGVLIEDLDIGVCRTNSPQPGNWSTWPAAPTMKSFAPCTPIPVRSATSTSRPRA